MKCVFSLSSPDGWHKRETVSCSDKIDSTSTSKGLIFGTPERLVLGSAKGAAADIRVPPQYRHVSRKHAVFVASNDQLYIFDSDAKYGTSVNGKGLVPNKLSPIFVGSTIRLCHQCRDGSIMEFQVLSVEFEQGRTLSYSPYDDVCQLTENGLGMAKYRPSKSMEGTESAEETINIASDDDEPSSRNGIARLLDSDSDSELELDFDLSEEVSNEEDEESDDESGERALGNSLRNSELDISELKTSGHSLPLANLNREPEEGREKGEEPRAADTQSIPRPRTKIIPFTFSRRLAHPSTAKPAHCPTQEIPSTAGLSNSSTEVDEDQLSEVPPTLSASEHKSDEPIDLTPFVSKADTSDKPTNSEIVVEKTNVSDIPFFDAYRPDDFNFLREIECTGITNLVSENLKTVLATETTPSKEVQAATETHVAHIPCATDAAAQTDSPFKPLQSRKRAREDHEDDGHREGAVRGKKERRWGEFVTAVAAGLVVGSLGTITCLASMST